MDFFDSLKVQGTIPAPWTKNYTKLRFLMIRAKGPLAQVKLAFYDVVLILQNEVVFDRFVFTIYVQNVIVRIALRRNFTCFTNQS